MFGATISLTIGGVAKVLNRVNQDDFGSEYRFRGTLDAVSLKIRHTRDNPDKDGFTALRHNVYIERVVYPTSVDPIKKSSLTFTIRGGEFDDPARGIELAEAAIIWLNSGTPKVYADLGVGVN